MIIYRHMVEMMSIIILILYDYHYILIQSIPKYKMSNNDATIKNKHYLQT